MTVCHVNRMFPSDDRIGRAQKCVLRRRMAPGVRLKTWPCASPGASRPQPTLPESRGRVTDIQRSITECALTASIAAPPF
jgi:hypothetical protein